MAVSIPSVTPDPVPFSQGRMDFAWEPPTAEELCLMQANWNRGKGMIGGNPWKRPNVHGIPAWAHNRQFVRSLMHKTPKAKNKAEFERKLQEMPTCEVEVGVGRGDFLLARAQDLSDRFFLGFEVKTGVAAKFLDRVERNNLSHLWVSDDDARFGFGRLLPGVNLVAVHVLFPDPWWKPKHRHRRLMVPPFIEILAAHLAQGGLLHVRSDVAEYISWTEYLLQRSGHFHVPDPTLLDALHPYQPTHREQWCNRQELPVYTLLCCRR